MVPRSARIWSRQPQIKKPFMKFVTLTKPIAVPHQIHTYTELQQQIHDDLRIQHPDWVDSDGSPPRVILTSRASGNCSAFRREGDPTSLPLLLIAPSNR